MLSWSLGVSLLLIVSSYNCDGFSSHHRPKKAMPRQYTNIKSLSPPRHWKQAALAKIETKITSKRKSWEERSATCAGKFKQGFFGCYQRYWTYYSRQTAVGQATQHLIQSRRTGPVIAKPLVSLFRLVARNDICFWWQCAIWDAIDWLSALVVNREHKWSSYSASLFGAPVVEKFVFRLGLLECFKYVFQKLLYPAAEKQQNNSNNDTPQTPPLLTPWSLFFAIGHMNIVALWYPDYLANSFMGLVHFAQNTKLVFEAFFGSLLFLIPMYEKHGLCGAIGAHSAWNVAVFVAGVGNTLLALHFLNRLKVNCQTIFSGKANIKHRVLPMSKGVLASGLCELWLEVLFLLNIQKIFPIEQP